MPFPLYSQGTFNSSKQTNKKASQKDFMEFKGNARYFTNVFSNKIENVLGSFHSSV